MPPCARPRCRRLRANDRRLWIRTEIRQREIERLLAGSQVLGLHALPRGPELSRPEPRRRDPVHFRELGDQHKLARVPGSPVDLPYPGARRSRCHRSDENRNGRPVADDLPVHATPRRPRLPRSDIEHAAFQFQRLRLHLGSERRRRRAPRHEPNLASIPTRRHRLQDGVAQVGIAVRGQHPVPDDGRRQSRHSRPRCPRATTDAGLEGDGVTGIPIRQNRDSVLARSLLAAGSMQKCPPKPATLPDPRNLSCVAGHERRAREFCFGSHEPRCRSRSTVAAWAPKRKSPHRAGDSRS